MVGYFVKVSWGVRLGVRVLHWLRNGSMAGKCVILILGRNVCFGQALNMVSLFSFLLWYKNYISTKIFIYHMQNNRNAKSSEFVSDKYGNLLLSHIFRPLCIFFSSSLVRDCSLLEKEQKTTQMYVYEESCKEMVRNVENNHRGEGGLKAKKE